MVDTFSALADPTRRTILEMLAKKGQLSAKDISEKFSVTSPAISQHLKVLREAELVAVQKQGQQRLYYMNADAMRELEEWAKQTRERWSQRFGVLDALLQVEQQRIKKQHKKAHTYGKSK